MTKTPAFVRRQEFGIFVLLVVLCAYTAYRNPQFLGATNLQNMARLIGLFGIFSLGLGIVIITGGIDLSVGSVFALLGVILSILLLEKHWSPALAVFVIILGGMGLGAIHGFLITRVRLQPFIVTLCGLLFYRGIARYIADDETKGFETTAFGWLRPLAAGNFQIGLGGIHLVSPDKPGLPMPFVLLLVASVILWIVLHRSVYGRYLFAVGRNEEAARYSGINTRRVTASAYVLLGALAGVTSVVLAFYTNSISPSSHGTSYELYGIAAAVLGGCSLRGGEGSIIGILLGTALLQVLQNLVNLLGIQSSLNFAVLGAVILIGVIADQVLGRGKARS